MDHLKLALCSVAVMVTGALANLGFVYAQGWLDTNWDDCWQCKALLQNGARIRLQGPTDMYVSTIGTDQPGCGFASGASACKTRSYIYYSILFPFYDLGGQTVTVHVSAGTHTDSMQLYGPMMVGQLTEDSFKFVGAGPSTLIQPVNGIGYTIGLSGGASARFENMKLDMTNNRVNMALGADTVSVGQGSKIAFGPGITFGCNFTGFNSLTVGPGASTYFTFYNDWTIDVTACQVNGLVAGYGIGTNALTFTSPITNLVVGMHLVPTSGGSGIPIDAYLGSLVGSNGTISCVQTNPCQFTATQAAQDMIATGGGQTFLDMGSATQGIFATNGQPDASLIVTPAGFPFYIVGFAFVNSQSGVNFQAVTFDQMAQYQGACFTARQLGLLDGGLQGVPYFPCLGGLASLSPIKAATLTAGSTTFTVPDIVGVEIGQAVNGYNATLGTWTAGASSISVASATGFAAGNGITLIANSGLLNHALIASVVGTTIGVNPCGISGPKCVSGYPTYQSKTNETVAVVGNGVPVGSRVIDISGAGPYNIKIDRPAMFTGAQQVIFQGRTQSGGIYE